MNLFPKSSGPPGAPSSSTEMYIRRRVTHEVNRALANPSQLPEWAVANPAAPGSFPPPPRTPACFALGRLLGQSPSPSCPTSCSLPDFDGRTRYEYSEYSNS